MQKQRTRIKCKIIYSNPASDILRSFKTTAYDQTIIYNIIFITLRCKKSQSPAKQFKELFSLVCYFFALNQPSSALNYLKTAFILTNPN